MNAREPASNMPVALSPLRGYASVAMKLRNRYRSRQGYRFPERFAAFEFVHGLPHEIGFTAVRARPHRNSFYFKKVLPTTKGLDDPPKLYARAAAGRTEIPGRG